MPRSRKITSACSVGRMSSSNNRPYRWRSSILLVAPCGLHTRVPVEEQSRIESASKTNALSHRAHCFSTARRPGPAKQLLAHERVRHTTGRSRIGCMMWIASPSTSGEAAVMTDCGCIAHRPTAPHDTPRHMLALVIRNASDQRWWVRAVALLDTIRHSGSCTVRRRNLQAAIHPSIKVSTADVHDRPAKMSRITSTSTLDDWTVETSAARRDERRARSSPTTMLTREPALNSL